MSRRFYKLSFFALAGVLSSCAQLKAPIVAAPSNSVGSDPELVKSTIDPGNTINITGKLLRFSCAAFASAVYSDDGTPSVVHTLFPALSQTHVYFSNLIPPPSSGADLGAPSNPTRPVSRFSSVLIPYQFTGDSGQTVNCSSKFLQHASSAYFLPWNDSVNGDSDCNLPNNPLAPGVGFWANLFGGTSIDPRVVESTTPPVGYGACEANNHALILFNWVVTFNATSAYCAAQPGSNGNASATLTVQMYNNWTPPSTDTDPVGGMPSTGDTGDLTTGNPVGANNPSLGMNFTAVNTDCNAAF